MGNWVLMAGRRLLISNTTSTHSLNKHLIAFRLFLVPQVFTAPAKCESLMESIWRSSLQNVECAEV